MLILLSTIRVPQCLSPRAIGNTSAGAYRFGTEDNFQRRAKDTEYINNHNHTAIDMRIIMNADQVRNRLYNFIEVVM